MGFALAGCAGGSDFHAGYAEIVAEEDARGGAGLDRIRRHLGGSSPELRAMSVRALGRMEDPELVDEIGAVLGDGDPAVRAAAAGALAQAVFGADPGPVAAMLTARIQEEPDAHACAAMAASLGRLGFRTAAQRTEIESGLATARERCGAAARSQRLTDSGRDAEQARADLERAADLGVAIGIEALARTAAAGSAGPARLDGELAAVARILARGSSSAPETLQAPGAGVPDAPPSDPLTDSALASARIQRLAVAALSHGDAEGRLLGPGLATAHMQHPDWGVRRQIVINAARHGTAAARVVPLGLADPDPRVRTEALTAYDRRLRATRGCAPILRAIADPDPRVSSNAIGLAAEPCADRVRQEAALLARAAQITGPDWRATGRALHSLAQVNPARPRDMIPRLAEHASPFARAWAARAARAAGDAGTLLDLAGDSAPNVREAALRALAPVAQADAAQPGDPAAATAQALHDLALDALDATDPQLVMTASALLARDTLGEFDPAATTSALLASLSRFTAARRETERDARAALLNAIGALGAFAAGDLAPYLTDFDPVIAGRAAELLAGAADHTGPAPEPSPQPLPRAATPDAERLRLLERSRVVLHMTHGDIMVRLRPDLAATNADRFARLAAEGRLDGLTFHRVEPNFVIQGGSPNANEYSGDGPYTRDEISGHPHWRGTVGLSTRGRDTGDGQIFVNLADNLRLDMGYTILGEVVEGMAVADAAQEGAVIERAVLVTPPDPLRAAELAGRVEVRRTEFGVPHILADDLEAMGFALGYVQSEDYGAAIATGMVASQGRLARQLGAADLDRDFVARETHARAAATFGRLDPRARAVYAGFAEGVNHYVRQHPGEFPAWIEPDFTGVDALARDVQTWSRGDAADYLLDGSNAWAFHGSRTESGGAILLRNPHLRWDGDHDLLDRPSGLTYYEAHVRVPGVIDFYGDFRIGTAFGIIGGFNPRLGWATTNNYPTLSQAYRLEAHPTLRHHAVLDGRPLPLSRREATVEYRTDEGRMASETRTSWHTPHGPVIHRAPEHVVILKDPRDGEFRRGEQFLRMMVAADLDEWLDVMHMRAHPTSNFTYADADGNIAHYYNARLPLLPHPVTGDTAAHAASAADMWSELVPWEDLPLYLNPPGGYVQQANDTPDYTNLNVPMDRDTVPPNLPERRLRLRSQLSLDLAANSGRLSLEDVIRLKHSPRVLMAERAMDDLLEAVEGADDGREQALAGGAQEAGEAEQALDGGSLASAGEDDRSQVIREAAAILTSWDRTAAAESRGAVLFARWADEYFGGAPDSLRWRETWDPERPTETPVGLADPEAAREALAAAAAGMQADRIALDARWGDVHRVVRGDVDEPVSGCPPTLGCFRTLSFETLEDGRRAANRGDAWVMLVEFGEVPRAYTVLAYGQTARPGSPHFADQAAMFARGEMKAVAWTEEEIRRRTIRRYRPGR